MFFVAIKKDRVRKNHFVLFKICKILESFEKISHPYLVFSIPYIVDQFVIRSLFVVRTFCLYRLYRNRAAAHQSVSIYSAKDESFKWVYWK